MRRSRALTITVQVGGVDIPAIITSYVTGPERQLHRQGSLEHWRFVHRSCHQAELPPWVGFPPVPYDGSANSFFDVFCE